MDVLAPLSKIESFPQSTEQKCFVWRVEDPGYFGPWEIPVKQKGLFPAAVLCTTKVQNLKVLLSKMFVESSSKFFPSPSRWGRVRLGEDKKHLVPPPPYPLPRGEGRF